jgi:hypothetical protein
VRAQAEDGWLLPGKNPCGLYLYAEDVDALTATVAPDVLGNGLEDKPWGIYEFSWGHRSGTVRSTEISSNCAGHVQATLEPRGYQ